MDRTHPAVLLVHFTGAGAVVRRRLTRFAFEKAVEIRWIGKTEGEGNFFQGMIGMKKKPARF